MLDEIFVFDNAIHCYDMSDENLREDVADARYSCDLLLSMGAGGRWAGYNDSSIEFKRRWTVEELYEMVFVDAPADMAMVQVVPILDRFELDRAGAELLDLPVELLERRVDALPERVDATAEEGPRDPRRSSRRLRVSADHAPRP